MDHKIILITDQGTKKMFEIAALILTFVYGTISTTGCSELENWLSESDFNMQVFTNLTNPETIKRLLQEKYN